MRRVVVAAAFALIGAWFSVVLLQTRAESLGSLDPLLAAVTVIGSVFVAPLPYLIGREKVVVLAERWAEFWSLSVRVAVPLVHLSLAITAIFLWDMLAILVFD
jgi:hypothetical protein